MGSKEIGGEGESGGQNGDGLSLNLRGQFATWSGPSRKRASPQLDTTFLLGKASSVAVASLSVVDSLIDLTFLAWR